MVSWYNGFLPTSRRSVEARRIRMRRRVFISYAQEDAKRIEHLRHVVDALGLEPVIDYRDLYPGDNLVGQIAELVVHVDIVIVAMSNNSLTSEWVSREEEIASAQMLLGAPMQVIYVNIAPNTNVPARIRSRVYVDLCSEKNREDQLLQLAKGLLSRPAVRRLGFYDCFHGVIDLNNRRENSNGSAGCDLNQFIGLAAKDIKAVGLCWGSLLGDLDSGAGLAKCLQRNADLRVFLYMPSLGAPKQQIECIHEYRRGIVVNIEAFLARFERWGRERGLSAAEAARIELRLLPFIPTYSMLAIDIEKPSGRMILDIYTPGIEPSTQMKIEIRYPTTPLYRMFKAALDNIKAQSEDGPKTSNL